MTALEYQNPRSRQTLREGVRELRAAEGADGDAAQNVAPDLVDVIDVHDAIHVLFACPTDLSGEIIAHVWTLFGTTMELRDMHRVNRHEDHRMVLARIGHGRLLRMWLRRMPTIAATLVRALRMTRRWPSEEYIEYLDMRLCDIRKEFGIHLPEPRRTTRSRGSKQPPERFDRPDRGGAALRSVRAR